MDTQKYYNTNVIDYWIKDTAPSPSSFKEQILYRVIIDTRLPASDNLFYLSTQERSALLNEAIPATIRQITRDDTLSFTEFVKQAPESDLDEAFVELDHWLVYGAFADGKLAAIASMIPWSSSQFADLGVITLPEYRNKGLGRKTVRAICSHAIQLGYEPQYRCQIDNEASVSLARSSGFSLFAAWDVIKS